MLTSAFLVLLTIFSQSATAATTSTQPATTAVDNSGINERDKNVTEVTADNQPMNKADTEITRLIRQDLVKDSSLSTYAHNVKIITDHGEVTLKGPVRSEGEKQKVLKTAMRIAGEKAVVNQLDIAR